MPDKKLSAKELAAQKNYFKQLRIKKHRTSKQMIFCMIGLVGSGKSTVANEIVRLTSATVISGDKARTELRKKKASYQATRQITKNLALEVLKQGGNLVIDSDFVDADKRQIAASLAKKSNAKLFYVRAHCQPDIAIGRMISAKYQNNTDDFFGGAASDFQGNAQTKGATVQIREMWRRTPLHYTWSNKDIARWELKKLPCKLLASLDTSNAKKWQQDLKKVINKLK